MIIRPARGDFFPNVRHLFQLNPRLEGLSYKPEISSFPISPKSRPTFGSRILRLFIGHINPSCARNQSPETASSDGLYTPYFPRTRHGGEIQSRMDHLILLLFTGKFPSSKFRRSKKRKLSRIALINRQKDVYRRNNTGRIENGGRKIDCSIDDEFFIRFLPLLLISPFLFIFFSFLFPFRRKFIGFYLRTMKTRFDSSINYREWITISR